MAKLDKITVKLDDGATDELMERLSDLIECFHGRISLAEAIGVLELKRLCLIEGMKGD